jgi:hypothetical protein
MQKLIKKGYIGCFIAGCIILAIIYFRIVEGPLGFIPAILSILSVFYIATYCIPCFKGKK